MEERVTVKAVSPMNEPACAGLTCDERATSRPPAHERATRRATAGNECARAGHLPRADAAPRHPAASLRERGVGSKRDTREERDRDGPER